jgi:large subunit ribosomal protein L20
MRIKYGKATRRKKNRIFREAKGSVGGRGTLWRTVQEHVRRSRAYAFRDRRARKRDFRALWITRINAACMIRGIRYSQFMHGLKLAQCELNRKILSELAIHNPTVFDEIVATAMGAVKKAAA